MKTPKGSTSKSSDSTSSTNSAGSFVELSFSSLAPHQADELDTVWQSDDRYYAQLSTPEHECCRACIDLHRQILQRLCEAVIFCRVGERREPVGVVDLLEAGPQKWIEFAREKCIHIGLRTREEEKQEAWTLSINNDPSIRLQMDGMRLLPELYCRAAIARIALIPKCKDPFDSFKVSLQTHKVAGSASLVLALPQTLHGSVEVRHLPVEEARKVNLEELAELMQMCDDRLAELAPLIQSSIVQRLPRSLSSSGESTRGNSAAQDSSRFITGAQLIEEAKALLQKVDLKLGDSPTSLGSMGALEQSLPMMQTPSINEPQPIIAKSSQESMHQPSRCADKE